MELEGSPVYYPQERQVHRRAAQPHPQFPELFGLMGKSFTFFRSSCGFEKMKKRPVYFQD